MKYATRGETASQRLHRGLRELREHGLSHLLRLLARSTVVRAQRRSTAIVRYVHWVAMRLTPPGTFLFQGSRYHYFRHPHNATWKNERAVEIPIVLRTLDAAGDARVLEVGNVLSHYVQHGHVIVDKYEHGANVLNVDIVEFRPDDMFDLIVSVSTLEHLGWDEEELDPDKIPRAIAHLRSLLSPGGRAVVTLPLGYNPNLDRMLRSEALDLDHEGFLLRTGRSEWREVSRGELGRLRYGVPFPGAIAVCIATILGEP